MITSKSLPITLSTARGDQELRAEVPQLGIGFTAGLPLLFLGAIESGVLTNADPVSTSLVLIVGSAATHAATYFSGVEVYGETTPPGQGDRLPFKNLLLGRKTRLLIVGRTPEFEGRDGRHVFTNKLFLQKDNEGTVVKGWALVSFVDPFCETKVSSQWFDLDELKFPYDLLSCAYGLIAGEDSFASTLSTNEATSFKEK